MSVWWTGWLVQETTRVYREDDVEFSVEVLLSEGNPGHSSDWGKLILKSKGFLPFIHSLIQQILIIYVLSPHSWFVAFFIVDNPLPFETPTPPPTFPSLALFFSLITPARHYLLVWDAHGSVWHSVCFSHHAPSQRNLTQPPNSSVGKAPMLYLQLLSLQPQTHISKCPLDTDVVNLRFNSSKTSSVSLLLN